jgi:DNA (cytosine-5)-methyltransferase 1
MEKIKLRTGPWNLSELKNVPKNGLKVFSCFHCGGGSSMGYKLAGYEVLGGVEIDPEMMTIYRQNHNPKHSYLMGVQEFKNIPDSELPAELFNLDILDGSPPCSSFSMAGSREKKWQVKKKFREGQAEQVLDDLFFDYIDIAKKLKPKVVVAENVKGLIQGNAKGYVKQIFQAFREAGYSCQLFLLNAAAMGVPQKRERTFFIANRIDKKINLDINEKLIPLKTAFEGLYNQHGKLVGPSMRGAGDWMAKHKSTEVVEWSKAVFNKENYFTIKGIDLNDAAKTLCASGRHIYYNSDRYLSDLECVRIQSFPDDYNFLKIDTGYVCGMSVPPFMMQRIASQIAIQFFDKEDLYG